MKLGSLALITVGGYVVWKLFQARQKFLSMRAVALNGKVAIVTGGTSGVGKEACKRLIKNGFKVVFHPPSAMFS
jgi:hypothetical protein